MKKNKEEKKKTNRLSSIEKPTAHKKIKPTTTTLFERKKKWGKKCRTKQNKTLLSLIEVNILSFNFNLELWKTTTTTTRKTTEQQTKKQNCLEFLNNVIN